MAATGETLVQSCGHSLIQSCCATLMTLIQYFSHLDILKRLPEHAGLTRPQGDGQSRAGNGVHDLAGQHPSGQQAVPHTGMNTGLKFKPVGILLP